RRRAPHDYAQDGTAVALDEGDRAHENDRQPLKCCGERVGEALQGFHEGSSFRCWGVWSGRWDLSLCHDLPRCQVCLTGQACFTLSRRVKYACHMDSRIRELRMEGGLSQQALAVEVGVSRQTINALET